MCALLLSQWSNTHLLLPDQQGEILVPNALAPLPACEFETKVLCFPYGKACVHLKQADTPYVFQHLAALSVPNYRMTMMMKDTILSPSPVLARHGDANHTVGIVGLPHSV